jgi:Chaperone of endosialidase
MTSKDCKDCDQPMQGADSRAPWEPPTFRRLVTKYAEGAGILQDEGHNCAMGGSDQHSCKNMSDARLKDDIVPLRRLENGIRLYHYRYKWSEQRFVGVMAQEVLDIVPDAVSLGADGYLRVDYERLGIAFMTWDQWLQNAKERLDNTH